MRKISHLIKAVKPNRLLRNKINFVIKNYNKFTTQTIGNTVQL
jgi:hypothetical protein